MRCYTRIRIAHHVYLIDIQDALIQLPSDDTLRNERDEIHALQAKSASEFRKWLKTNPNQTLRAVFGVDTEEEFDKIAAELREKESRAAVS